MSDNDKGDGADPGEFFRKGAAFAKFWNDMSARVAAAGLSVDPSQTPPDLARQTRAAFFKAMGDSCEEFMRSEEFLQAMRDGMRNAIAFKKQMNDFLAASWTEAQGASRGDVDQIMSAIRRSGERAEEALADVAARLDAIERRVATLEKGAARGRGGARAAGAPPRPSRARRVKG